MCAISLGCRRRGIGLGDVQAEGSVRARLGELRRRRLAPAARHGADVRRAVPPPARIRRTAEPLESSFAEDAAIVLRSLADDGRGAAGGHVVAHAQGAIPAMMAAVERPDLVHSLTLVEPACLSLTAELPATAAHIRMMKPLFDVRHQLSDEDFQREFVRRVLRRRPAPASHAGGEALCPPAAAAVAVMGGATSHRSRSPHPCPHRRMGTAVRRNRRLPAGDRCPAPRRRGRAPAPRFSRRQPGHPAVPRRSQPE